MIFKNKFLILSLLCVASVTNIHAMDQEMILQARRENYEQLTTRMSKLLEEDRKKIQIMEKNYPEVHSEYNRYYETIKGCSLSYLLKPKTPHPKDSHCPQCRKLYNNLSDQAKELLNLKGSENLIEKELAFFVRNKSRLLSNRKS